MLLIELWAASPHSDYTTDALVCWPAAPPSMLRCVLALRHQGSDNKQCGEEQERGSTGSQRVPEFGLKKWRYVSATFKASYKNCLWGLSLNMGISTHLWARIRTKDLLNESSVRSKKLKVECGHCQNRQDLVLDYEIRSGSCEVGFQVTMPFIVIWAEGNVHRLIHCYFINLLPKKLKYVVQTVKTIWKLVNKPLFYFLLVISWQYPNKCF